MGVTCAAVVLGCRSSSSDAAASLRALRTCLARHSPHVDFDALTYEGGEAACRHERPLLPLNVLVHRENCAFRVSAATTRHLLDTVAFALGCASAEERLCRSSYAAWRRRTMVRAARLCPLDSTSVSQTLHAVVASLDGHPCVDALHVAEEEGGVEGGGRGAGASVVLCTLRDRGVEGAERYVPPLPLVSVAAGGGAVLVRRGGRAFPAHVAATRDRRGVDRRGVRRRAGDAPRGGAAGGGLLPEPADADLRRGVQVRSPGVAPF